MNILFALIKTAPSLFIIALLLGILSHLRNKSTKSFEKSKQDFWDREQSANAVRKKDISNLPYIVIPPRIYDIAQQFSQSSLSDQDRAGYYEELSALSDKKILNLNGKSNTDLKLEYGTANITVLSAADTCYTELISILAKLGTALYEIGKYSEAREILEYSADIESDVLNSYRLLLDIYEKIMPEEEAKKAKEALQGKAEKLDSIRRDAILALFCVEETTPDEESS